MTIKTEERFRNLIEIADTIPKTQTGEKFRFLSGGRVWEVTFKELKL